MARLKITQTKSDIGSKQNQRDTLRSLGLKRIDDVVVKEDRPEIRGMVHTVAHLSRSRRSTDMAEQNPLKVHHLRPAPGAKTAKTRVGRGEGSKGKTAGHAGAGDAMRFVRVGTLDEPGALPPDIHIYTNSKQSWFTLPPGTPAVAEFYKGTEVWSKESRERWAAQQAKQGPATR